MAQDLDYMQGAIILDKQAADVVVYADKLTMYLGFCQNGTGVKDTSQAIWAVCKVVQSQDTYPYTVQILWSNGQRMKNQVFDAYAALNYTFKQF